MRLSSARRAVGQRSPRASVWLKVRAPIHADDAYGDLRSVDVDDEKVICAFARRQAGLHQMLKANGVLAARGEVLT